MSENNQTTLETSTQMADPHRSQSNGEMHDLAVELAGVTARLDAIRDNVRELHSDVREINRKVGEQNGRVNAIERKCVAHDSMVVHLSKLELQTEEVIKELDGRVKTLETYHDESVGAGVSVKLDSMEVRVKDLEEFKQEAGGAMKATFGIVRDSMMILTFVLAAWRIVGEQRVLPLHTHESATTEQRQGLK